jgi:adenylyl- and sulfurtransferase ThiI
MAMELIIVRYGELGLKGHNRQFFERRLIKNIKLCLRNASIPFTAVRRLRGRILVYSDEKAIPFLKDVFGISSLSIATAVPLELEAIKNAALEYAKQRKFASFRITTQRVNVRFPLDSMSVDKIVGEVIFETLHKPVDLHNPNLNIHIELIDQAYIFADKIECHAGLPVGSEGRVICLMDNPNSLLAAVLIMKRGCSVLPCGKAEMDLSPLKRYYPSQKLQLRKIKDYAELDKIAQEKRIKAVVVADTISEIKEYPTQMLVLRPLVGYTPEEVESLLKKYFGHIN